MTNPERGRSLLRFASPQHFYPLAGRLAPWFAAIAVVLTVIGLWLGFFVAPTDATQGQVYRVIFIHVPAAWMSMFIYLVMAFWSAVGLIMNTRLSFVMSQALAPTGAMFCFVALWTGALWGKPTWGAYWVWDARLTSQLLLSREPAALWVMAKVLAFWISTGLPVIAIAPAMALLLDLEQGGLMVLILSLALGTPILALLGAVGAALTLGLRGGGMLLALLVLPLFVPVLIFGAGAVEAELSGTGAVAHLLLLGGGLAGALALAPVACAAALRISTD